MGKKREEPTRGWRLVKSCGLRIACILSLLWGGWWTFFGLASGIGEEIGVPGILMHALVPGLIFLATALAAPKMELYRRNLSGTGKVFLRYGFSDIFRIGYIHHTWVTDGLAC